MGDDIPFARQQWVKINTDFINNSGEGVSPVQYVYVVMK